MSVKLLFLILILLLVFLIKKKENFTNEDTFVMTIATENYSEKLENSLLSYQKNNNKKLNVYCINWNKSLLNNFREKYNNFNFIPHNERSLLKNKKAISGNVLKLKIKLINDAMVKYNKDIVYFDADTRINNKIEPLVKKLKNYDVMISKRQDKIKTDEIEKKTFLCGVMLFKNNKNGKLFLKNYNKNTQNSKEKVSKFMKNSRNIIDGWWHDQVGFYKTFQDNRNFKYYFLNNQEHNIIGKHSHYNKEIKNSIFQSF
tara:strand:+ start:64 stop:837 length:774 start_codon:yes stop_codon:yes gene_type:complete